MSARLDPTKTIFFPPIDPEFPGNPDPWPDGPFGPLTTVPRPTHGRSVRDDGGAKALDAVLASLPDMLVDALGREDYDAIMKAYGPVIQRQLESDPDLMAAFRALLERYGLDPEQLAASSDDREPITISATTALVVFGLGVVAGWLAED